MNDQPRILIVDDDEGTRKTLTLILRQKGYETATAATGQEALEQAREQAFNLAFLDIRLPDMAGLDLITPLQELQPHVAVIMITGHASVGTAVQAMNAGAAGYVTKPVNLDELLARAREALEKQRLGEEKRQAEAALRQSEERFRQFFEGMPEYGYLISPQGLILDVNHAACRALGYGKEELVGQSPQTIYAPESLPQMEQLLDRWGETGQIRDEELVILTRAGERRTVLLSADAVRGRAGQILHSVSVQRDITARKRAEEGLQRRTEELELLYEAGQQLSQTLDPNSIYAQLHESLSHIMDCDVLVLSSFDPEDQLIRCAFAAIEGEQQDVSGYPPVLLNSAGRGTQSVAIRTGEPLLLPDYQAWVKTSNKTYYIDKGGGVVDHQETPADANVTRSALIVPLKLQGQVVGGHSGHELPARCLHGEQLADHRGPGLPDRSGH
ncbi:MAG: response regulator [Chloroflexi bacterium]|nr:response regulator [Chloroflexota bacterium]